MDASFLLAAVLLTSPPAEPVGDVLPPPVPEALVEFLRPSLLALALDAEILDAREILPGSGYANRPEVEFWQDHCQELRGRYQQFRDTPQLAEADRFPPPKLLSEQLALNRSVRAHLQERLALDLFNAEEIRALICGLDGAYHALDVARDCGQVFYFAGVRRASLRTLRDLLGAENFYRGVLPAAIPEGCLATGEAAEPEGRVPRRMPIR